MDSFSSSSIRGRYSLSTTNLSIPIAESTCLNGIGSRSKFNWGEGTISYRNRNNSHTLIDKNNSMSKNLNGIPAKVSMSPTSSRIDPRTYIDIHSNGLASRIVKYHDNSTRLNRSLSMTNLYNKPGQFPVVHLKKNEQQYKAKKNKNLSMTRIAAPEKSAFHGNTLSSILRSGSIVGLQKSDEEISRENRPILHPPPTENEMAPTRSVLEVLKEISRKRINSDEMNGTELTKKQCKESEQDPTSNTSQRTLSKRQREITNSTNSTAQISPEQQVIKKRMCNYNNDIMSSLSSSMASINKRKIIGTQSQKRTASDLGALSTTNTSSTDFEFSRNEKQRCVEKFQLQHLTPSTKFAPITPLPSTPHQSVSELDGANRNGIVSRRASEPVLSNTKPKLTLFNKNYDEVPTNVNNNFVETRQDDDLCGIQFVKPKKSSSMSSSGSLLMEKTKKSKLALMLSGLKGELGEEDEIDAVLPKEKEKQHVPVDVPVKATVTPVSSISSSSSLLSTSTPVAVTKIITATKQTTDDENKQKEASSTLKLIPSTVTSTCATSSNGFQINTAPILAATSTTTATVSVVNTTAPIVSTTSTITLKPAPVGFSFGLTVPSTMTSALTSQTTTPPQATKPVLPTNSTLPAAGLVGATKPFAFSSATTQASASTAPSFTFGAPNTVSQLASSTKESSLTTSFGSATSKTTDSAPQILGQSAAPIKPAFSFGSLAGANTTNSLTKAMATPITTTALPPNFASQTNTWNSSTTPASNAVSKTPIIGIGSFGGSSSSLPQSTTALTSNSSTGGFSFGSSSTNEASKSFFSTITPANTTSTNSNTTFSFSTNKAPTNPTTPNNGFTFGAVATPSPAVAPNTAMTFAAAVPTPVTNANPQNIFGNTATPKPSNTFTFGSSGAVTSPQKGAFAFSTLDKNTVAPPSTGTSVGGFSFNNPPASSLPIAEVNKNIFGTSATAAADTKPAFNFGSSTISNPTTDKPPMFGASTNIFGAPATLAAPQKSPFAFGQSSNEATHQAPANIFGAAPTTNITSGLGAPASSSTIFGAPSAAVAPLQQSSTFTFGASSSTKQEPNKPAGGFVFGSSSSIGSNASKPAVDMNKTFVFGDGNTTIKPATTSATNLFGGNSTINGTSSISGATDNKMFSFGAPAGGSNNTFAATRQTVNPAPAFNFGAPAPASTATPAPNANLFAPQGQPPTDRPIRKAMRRLHKT